MRPRNVVGGCGDGSSPSPKVRGTSVKNPVHRSGYSAYKECSMCGGVFTALGLSRHWDHCPAKSPAKKGARS